MPEAVTEVSEDPVVKEKTEAIVSQSDIGDPKPEAEKPETPAEEVKPEGEQPEAVADGEGLKIAEPTPEAEQTDLKSTLKKKGIDLDALYDEHEKLGGKLADATYKSLAGKGYDRAIIELAIEGLKATAENTVRQVKEATGKCNEIAGGAEKMAALLQAAPSFLSKVDIERLNRDLSGRDANGRPSPDRMEAATYELISRYQRHIEKNPSAGTSIAGGRVNTASSSNGSAFRSAGEIKAAEKACRDRGIDPSQDSDYMARFAATPIAIRRSL